jgi:hypothetical protein
VDGADLGRVIGIPMMALGKNVNRCHVGIFQSGGKFIGIEIHPYSFTLQRGMEIQVYLAVRLVKGSHGFSYDKNMETATDE